MKGFVSCCWWNWIRPVRRLLWAYHDYTYCKRSCQHSIRTYAFPIAISKKRVERDNTTTSKTSLGGGHVWIAPKNSVVTTNARSCVFLTTNPYNRDAVRYVFRVATKTKFRIKLNETTACLVRMNELHTTF